MAVVQISRIQVRRGTVAAGSSLPQLASGELAWAIDSQELWIGNGSVSEGAPAVGNTKILTLNDLSANGNVLNIIQYIFAPNVLTTAPGALGVTSRTIQQRLDDHVITTDFGTTGSGVPTYSVSGSLRYSTPSGSTDDTASLQLALQQLFANAPQAWTDAGTQNRYVLDIPPGVYILTSTLYVPSYATIRGAGSDKTIFYSNITPTPTNPNPPAIQIVNTSFDFTALTQATTADSNKPSNVTIQGITIWTAPYTSTADSPGVNPALLIDSLKDSQFIDIHFKGNAFNSLAQNAVPDTHSVAIQMNAFSASVTCQHNVFRDCKFENFYTMVNAKFDIRNNTFDNCYFDNSIFGFMFGIDSFGTQADGVTVGQIYGPRENVIVNCKFNNIKEQAVYIQKGIGNVIENLRLLNVGSLGSSINGTTQYPQIYFNALGNRAANVYSDRTVLITDQTHLLTPYAPEITGSVSYTSFGETVLTLTQQTNPVYLFRLPLKTDNVGQAIGTIIYNVEYFYVSTQNNFSRKGTLSIVADKNNNRIQLADEYEYAGINGLTDSLDLDFTVSFLDTNGAKYIAGPGQSIGALGIYYANSLTGDTGTLTFTYKFIS